jgi:serine/threonine protein kinase
LTVEAHNPNPLRAGTRLSEYRITGVLGEGGFGIVYSALDEALGRTIAIKEYLPASIAGRTGDLSVRVRSLNNIDAFKNGLQSFMREARLLAQFSHPALVEVYRIWEENETAYIAMRLCQGKTARELRAAMNEGFDEDEIRRLLLPVFDAVAALHAKDVIHRDISPDNVMISPNGAATLLDLGAARIVLAGLTQALTTVLKPGYAPIEQYMDDGSMKQGPWTDVYGLAALIYYLARGEPPAQSIARTLRETLVPLPTGGERGFSQRFSDAVTHALAVQPSQRPQTVAEFAQALGWSGDAKPMPIVKPSAAGEIAPTVIVPNLPTAPSAQNTSAASNATDNMRAESTSTAHASYDAEATVAMPRNTPITTKSGTTVTPSDTTARSTPSPAMPSRGASTTPPKRRTPFIVGGAALLIAAVAGIGVVQYRARSALSDAIANLPPNDAAQKKETGLSTTKEEPKRAPTESAPPQNPPAKPVETAPNATEKAAENAVEVEAKKQADEKKKRDAEAAALAARQKQEMQDATRAAVEKLAAEKRKQQIELDRAAKKAREEKEATDRAAAQRREEQLALQRSKDEAATKAVADAAKATANANTKSSGSTSPPPSAAPTPSNQVVNDLSALALKAYKDGRLQEARGYWSQIANMPEASARSRAQAHANTARTYCTAGDRATCERYYTQAIRSDSSYRLSDSDAAQPQIGEAYRAARTRASGGGY